MLTKEEYLAKQKANTRIENPNTLQAKMHMACPRCAAPDWLVFPLLEMGKAYAEGAVCKPCGFGGRILLNSTVGMGGFELVQTAGPDMLEFQTPLRRV